MDCVVFAEAQVAFPQEIDDLITNFEQNSPTGLIICHTDGIGSRDDETSWVKT